MNILKPIWNFIIKQICFVDKDAYDNKVIESQKHKIRLDSIKKFIDDTNILYCIVPYFNFVNSKKRKQLFLDFINKYNMVGLKLIKGIKSGKTEKNVKIMNGLMKFLI